MPPVGLLLHQQPHRRPVVDAKHSPPGRPPVDDRARRSTIRSCHARYSSPRPLRVCRRAGVGRHSRAAHTGRRSRPRHRSLLSSSPQPSPSRDVKKQRRATAGQLPRWVVHAMRALMPPTGSPPASGRPRRRPTSRSPTTGTARRVTTDATRMPLSARRAHWTHRGQPPEGLDGQPTAPLTRGRLPGPGLTPGTNTHRP